MSNKNLSPAKWRVVGTKSGYPKAVCVRAPDWKAAVAAASHAPHLLVVKSAVLVDVGGAA